MKMKPNQLGDWFGKVQPAVFSCRVGPAIGRSATANLYPLKSGKGFMWIVWEGVEDSVGFNIANDLRAGGTTARSFDRACVLVLHELISYRNGPNKRRRTRA